MTRIMTIRAVALAVVLAGTPLAFSAETGVRTNTACAQDPIQPSGCCKQQTRSICNDGKQDVQNAYYTTQNC